MNLKDCKVTLMLNMYTGFAPTTKEEEIVKDILEIACPTRVIQWEYGDEFIQSLSDKGVDLKSLLFIPSFYIHMVGGYGTCFTATTIASFFKQCFENNIDVSI